MVSNEVVVSSNMITPDSELERKYQEFLVGNAKAKDILGRFLTPQQRADYATLDQFTVQGGNGLKYVIETDRGTMNIVEYNRNGDRRRRFCLQSYEPIFRPELFLVQKLMIENDINRFLALANTIILYDEPGKEIPQ